MVTLRMILLSTVNQITAFGSFGAIEELRVTYMDSAVLELRLPRAVEAAAAAAKLSSKLRRVVVDRAASQLMGSTLEANRDMLCFQ